MSKCIHCDGEACKICLWCDECSDYGLYNSCVGHEVRTVITDLLKDKEYAEYLENIYQINFDEEVKWLVFQAERNMRIGRH